MLEFSPVENTSCNNSSSELSSFVSSTSSCNNEALELDSFTTSDGCGGQGPQGPPGPPGPSGTGSGSLWVLNVPTIKLMKPTDLVPAIDIQIYNSFSGTPSGNTISLSTPPILNPKNDLSDEQITQGVWIELLVYKSANGRKTNYFSEILRKANKGYVIPTDLQNGVNEFEAEIKNTYGVTKLLNRSGVQYGVNNSGGTAINIDRPNQKKITDLNTSINLTDRLNGRFIYGNNITGSVIEYTNDNVGNVAVLNATYPIGKPSHNFRFGTGSLNNYGNYKTYDPHMKNMYIKFRYIMFNKDLNGGLGNFVVGPTTETIQITPFIWPFYYIRQEGAVTYNGITTQKFNDSTLTYDPFIWKCNWVTTK